MAGNTKFTGFLDNHRVQLERWGTKVAVVLDEASVETLRKACYNDLPKKPNLRPPTHFADFVCGYSEELGRVQTHFTPEVATYLADLLDVLVKNNVDAMEKVMPWVEKLKAAAQAHVDYHSGTDEPGVIQ